MKLTAWRIFKPRFAAMAFTGDGARLFGGRWNSKGTSVVYTAGSLSLAALEMLVHLQNPQILEAYVAAEVSFDSRLMQTVDPAELPTTWRTDPAPAELKALGDQWIAEAHSAVLQVPSAVVESEYNYLLNPGHADFARVTIGAGQPFAFDPRLVK